MANPPERLTDGYHGNKLFKGECAKMGQYTKWSKDHMKSEKSKMYLSGARTLNIKCQISESHIEKPILKYL